MTNGVDPRSYSTVQSVPTLVGGPGITISHGGPGYYGGAGTIGLDLKNNAEFREVQNRLSDIEKQLCILKSNEALQEKYPALQEAYDAYQLILKIVQQQKGDV